MKNTILVFVLLVSINICMSQNKSGIVTYKKELLIFQSEKEGFEKENQKRPKYTKNVQYIDNKVKHILIDLEFILKYSKNKSYFKVQDYLGLEKDGFLRFAIGPLGSGIYYTDLKKNEYYTQLDAFGQLFLIKRQEKSWEITTKTKKIGGYLCYKAISFKTNKKRTGGINKIPVTAWFTPSIPVPFGPIGYGGLPGLIIDITVGNMRFYTSKINLNIKEKINIKKPTQGKVVSKEEFEEIGSKTMKELKRTGF